MIEDFGITKHGDAVKRIGIAGGGLKASIITRGAALQDLRLDGHTPPLVIGLNSLADYEAYSGYLGATVGRFANRIGGGRFVLDGQEHRLDQNNGANCLHGGSNGFSERNWTVEESGTDFVTLMLESPNGEMGFPGTLTVRCTYRLEKGGALRIDYDGTTEAPTVCALSHHSYFNLEDGGAGPITGHRMQMEADRYTPVDDALIPDGPARDVSGTPFDFRTPRVIGSDTDYDHNFCFSDERMALRKVLALQAPVSRVTMEMETTEPGVQFFSAPRFSCPVPGLDGIRYGHHAGMCLEAQIWPDAPNRGDFPSAVLRPGERYRHTTRYIFSKD